MNLIACTDAIWGIGLNGDLLVRIPEDLKHFKKMTLEKIVIMGRKTLESLPNGKPLPGRRNIILSSDTSFKVPGALVVNSFDELHTVLQMITDLDDVYIIGGESIYKEMVNWENVNLAYITQIYHDFGADKYFPNLDENPNWKLVSSSPMYKFEDYEYNFAIYQKIYN